MQEPTHLAPPERALDLDLYRELSRIRQVEERIAGLYAEQQMRCPVHLCVGQEAVAVGVCAALERTDRVLSGHRSHGHYLAKGGALKPMLAEMYGKATGCAGGKGGSMHLVDLDAGFVAATPIVGATIPIAVGMAFASKTRGTGEVTVTFFGDAATEEGVFHEAILFAALQRLPVLFVCENNLYSVYSTLEVRQPPDRDVGAIAAANGLAVAAGDGNDVLEVHSLARDAVERARSGEGPTYLEFETYRFREHVGPDYDPPELRPDAEVAAWRLRDPVEGYRRHLLEHGFGDSELDTIDADLADEIEDAVRFAKESPMPAAEEFATNIYPS